MQDPTPLDTLFQAKIFRIPDYQRGYAWQREQLKDFWEDLINLAPERSHYTGVLTLKLVPPQAIDRSDKEYWLVEDHSYQLFHVVDGQQRLTTFIICIQALVDVIKESPQNKGKSDADIFLTESLNVAEVQNKYLFRTKPSGDQFRTYLFGYTVDNPSHDYLRFRILGEIDGGAVEETFYTLNLSNAMTYFTEQFREVHERTGGEGLQDVYKKLTKRFLFNEYVIKNEFDVFVAFETMNNRGKRLSDLELLKNRLIFLTTLYNDQELDAASRKSLRGDINEAWKEVYHQLGRNKVHPLNDDDFLKAHWTMFFKYSRKTGRAYIHFLLDEQFTAKKIHGKIEREVTLETPEEKRADHEFEEPDDGSVEVVDDAAIASTAQLQPKEISDFVHSLKESAVHWFNSFYPDLAQDMSTDERHWLENLNRVGMQYFRPLIMSILKNVGLEADRLRMYKRIERFIFIAFRMNAIKADYSSSEFYNAARALDRGEIQLSDIEKQLEEKLSYSFDSDQAFRSVDFYNLLRKKVDSGVGYYGWSGLRYFLYEYERSLLEDSRQEKLRWDDLLKSEKDKVSIEHIYPQKETDRWEPWFADIENDQRRLYNISLGNLLVLSMSINSSLQNDSFDEKKQPKWNDSERKIRNGYSDGSHSEIEVSREDSWGPHEIKTRGLKLLRFMETRWDFRFKNDAVREELLFLNFTEPTQ